VDFNKSCEERNGMYLPYSGVAIYYVKCDQCDYLFTTDFDEWSKEDFLDNIYNDDYITVDPEYDGKRSVNDAKYFINNLRFAKNMDILDYGAGPGVLGNELNQAGYHVESWDPMWGTDPTWEKDKKFDLVMAWEVMEHTPTPQETLKEMMQWLRPGGQILLCTLSTGIMQGKRDPAFWYLSPRNGHVCMYSDKSLDTLFDQVGMRVQHDPWSIHLASFK
jgi:2-polyprenyl-3-methyl-5-hydroxy-6-metoxy-1,4-benzoquinol methylase